MSLFTSSSSSSSSQKLVLIEKPKNQRERENNKAYYQQKFFSLKQKRDLEERKHAVLLAYKDIDRRQEYGTSGTICGGHSLSVNPCNRRRKAKAIEREVAKAILARAAANNCVKEKEEEGGQLNPLLFEVNTHPHSQLNIQLSPGEVVDSWEDLC
jgi:hypothetical protein